MPVSIRSRRLQRRSVRLGEVARRAEAMLSELGLSEAELSILVCDDDTIRELNRRYRKKNKATDVLAFPLEGGPAAAPGPRLLGDVVISLPTATRQAHEHDRPIVAEVTFLLAHGLLHLVGYDHATRAEEREMTARTEQLVAAARADR